MKNYNIELNDQEKYFIKKFAENHFPGSKKNLCTEKPIHTVDVTRYIWTQNDECDHDNAEYCIIFDSEEYYNLKDLFEGFIDEDIDNKYDIDINDCGINMFNIKEKIEEFENENKVCVEYDVYVKIPYYEPVAFFWIREEAERYLEYQSHNLHKPRVYTRSGGYSNCGGYSQTWDVLYKLGCKIIENDELKENK